MAAQINAQLELIRKLVHKNPIVKQYADIAEEKTKVPIEYFVAGLLVIPLILIYAGYLREFTFDVLGYVYPVFATIKSLEKKTEDHEWLTYWVVFSLFNILCLFLDPILGFSGYWLPLKIAFTLSLYLPQVNGAKVIFEKGVTPAMAALNKALEA